MRLRRFSAFLLFLVPVSAVAQEIFPNKDLAFAQIAAGGGYETVLNLTNRGTTAYSGVLTLMPADRTRPFPLLVNGTPLTDGRLNLSVAPGQAATLRITSGDPSLGTLSGFAVIHTADRTQTSLLEGNLTYYVLSPEGQVLDSVGVPPSSEIFQAVIPFEDFRTVALALANQNSAGQSAHVTLTLFNDQGAQVGAPLSLPLENNQQAPRFLFEHFPGASLTRGRVEIRSDRLILGTALTIVNGESSSLPLRSSVKAYNYTANVSGVTLSGELYLMVEGPHVIGYEHPQTFGVSGVNQASGVVHDGDLEIYVHGARGQSTELLVYGLIRDFSTGTSPLTGTVIGYFVNPPLVAGSGTITLTAIN